MVTSLPDVVVGGTTLSGIVGSSNTYVVERKTLTPGGSITVDGTIISLAPGGTALVVNGVTQTLGAGIVTSLPDITVGGTTLSGIAGAGSTYVVEGKTLTPGGSITVDGTIISLAPGATALVIDGTTQAWGSSTASLSDIVIGGTTLSGLFGAGSTYVIDGQVLTIGGTITVDGTTISFPSATAVVVNGITQTLVAPAYTTNAPDLTIAGTVYTDSPGPGTTYIIHGATLTPGGAVTVDGTTISLSPSATALVVDGVTTTLFPATRTAAATGSPILTIDGQTYTALPNSGSAGPTYVVGGQSLTPGGYVVVDGTTISLGASATVLVVDGRTQTLAASAGATATAGAGEAASAGSNAGAAATATATGGGGGAAEYTGAASAVVVGKDGSSGVLSLFVGVVFSVLIGLFAW
ncbi:hypothetical protein BK809_0001199 [Diplodia seriata]|uniref:Uncharacterized protein n=1 Tax=Diplodia seriata TaxID=420778 RepID=A0A1S8B6J3_9PEZI|nr:hypothetical protein BK809_0001199 [Diplodia seriata]